MTVVHIAYQYGRNNTGGAAVAATRLHLALLAHGVDSHYVCIRQVETGTNVHALKSWSWLFAKLYSVGKIKALWHYLNLPIPGFGSLIRKINPDIVHVHWLNTGGPSLRQIGKTGCKIVVNLHDAWMFNAEKPVAYDDNRWETGYTRDNSSLLERIMFARKVRFFERVKPIVIGPSKWVCEEGRKSIVAKHCEFNVVSNIIDAPFFREINQPDHDNFRIVFGCNKGSRNRGKRFCDLIAAVDLIPQELKSGVEIIVFGEMREPELISGVFVRYVGDVSNSVDLAKIYSDGDLFAFPSLSETQGLTKIEAMACGLPVVAFNRTACAESIEHMETGWIAHDGDIKEFAQGIMYFYNLKIRGALPKIKKSIRMKIKAKFSTETTVARILSIYTRQNEA